MITAQRLIEIEEQLLNIQLELQQYITVEKNVQATTNSYQDSAVSALQRARFDIQALAHNIQKYKN